MILGGIYSILSVNRLLVCATVTKFAIGATRSTKFLNKLVGLNKFFPLVHRARHGGLAGRERGMYIHYPIACGFILVLSLGPS